MLPSIIELQTEFRHPSRQGAPLCFVLHTTGTSRFDEAIRYYQTSSEGISPHYVIDLSGALYRLVPDDQVAYHCGYGTAQGLYAQGLDVWTRWAGKPPKELQQPFSGYTFWRERWPGKQSPLELACGAAPNGRSIGIELLAPRHPTPSVFTDPQYTTCAELLADRSTAHRIPLDRAHVLGHEDVNPVARADRRGGTDPGRGFDWDRILSAARGARAVT